MKISMILKFKVVGIVFLGVLKEYMFCIRSFGKRYI